MSKPQNIACFEFAAAGILGRLYQQFPLPILILARRLESELVESTELPLGCCWPESPGKPHESLVAGTIDWLAAEGLLRFSAGAAGRYSGCVLTAAGFTSLNSPLLPVETSPAATVGESLIRAARDGITSGLSGTIAALLQSAIDPLRP